MVDSFGHRACIQLGERTALNGMQDELFLRMGMRFRVWRKETCENTHGDGVYEGGHVYVALQICLDVAYDVKALEMGESKSDERTHRG